MINYWPLLNPYRNDRGFVEGSYVAGYDRGVKFAKTGVEIAPLGLLATGAAEAEREGRGQGMDDWKLNSDTYVRPWTYTADGANPSVEPPRRRRPRHWLLA